MHQKMPFWQDALEMLTGLICLLRLAKNNDF